MGTTLTIRQLPEETKYLLRRRAASNGRSMEAEARAILREALARPAAVDLSWVEELIMAGESAGGVDLELPDRDKATAADFT